MGYVFLFLAIMGEVFGTTMLKLSDGFSNLLPTIGIGAGFVVAFFFLSKALKALPLSIAYATWAGVGTASTVLVGLIGFGESMNAIQIIAVLLVLTGVTLINTDKGAEKHEKVSRVN